MQRPIMNPLFLDGVTPPRPRQPRLIWRATRALLRIIYTILFRDMLFWRPQLQVEDGPLLGQFLRGLVYRLLFLPFLVAIVAVAFVYLGIHPTRLSMNVDPLSRGYYYEPVSMAADDGNRVDGWLVPIVDARKVIEQKQQILQTRYPAIVLVHDHTGDMTQMLPLIQPFHDAGYIVLVIGLRGSKPGLSRTTFGLSEAQDVEAGIALLRRRSNVDGAHITLLGVGSGANAALAAAVHDQGIAAVILDHPMHDVDEMIRNYLSPQQPWLAWMRPLCKWTFEIVCQVDADEINLPRSLSMLDSRTSLVFESPTTFFNCLHGNDLPVVQQFLASRIGEDPKKTATADVKE